MLTSRTPLAIAFASSLLAAAPTSAQPPRYRIIDLGTFDDDPSLGVGANGGNCVGYRINDDGIVLGRARRGLYGLDNAAAVVRWGAGPFGEDALPGFDPGLFPIIWSFTNSGAFTGQMKNPATGLTEPYICRDNRVTFQYVSTPAGALRADGWVMNDAGAVAGTASFWDPVAKLAFQEIIRWDVNLTTYQRLGSLGWTPAPRDMNSAGDICGAGYLTPDGAAGIRPLVIRGGVMTDLNAGHTDYLLGAGEALNGAGEVAGWVKRASNQYARPACWNAGGVRTLLPTLPFPYDYEAIPADINDRGQIVGRGAGLAVTWIDGQIYDLNEYYDADPSDGWVYLSEARSINRRGQIVGVGARRITSQFQDLRAFLLTPIPACAADYNNDGAGDALDYDDFIREFLRGAPAADLNFDRFVDALDYNLFIDSWLAGC